jgi:hypothetical protein
MASPVTLAPGAFAPVVQTIPGQTISLIARVDPAAPPLLPETINSIAQTVQQAIASDLAANTSGTTPAPPPNNFAFTDLTVNVSGEITGDLFKGSTPGVAAQFIDLTPDNLMIQARGPNLFVKSDTGNDALIASSGRNVLSAGSGVNLMIGGSGQDTFMADASKASASETILNFGSTDDVAMLGINLTDFSISLADTAAGLQIGASPLQAANPIRALIDLPGYKIADFTTNKLSIGIGSTVSGTSFLFVHAA